LPQINLRSDAVGELTVGKEIFVVEIAVRWGDQDANSHVNNVAYFRYLEEARVQWMAQRGVMSAGAPVGPVAVTAGATFLKSIAYPALLHVTVEVAEVGARSITLHHRIIDAADPTLCYAEGYAKLVWVDSDLGKSVPLPERLLHQLGLPK
jgi:acyl-CoA thioester hydrolase